MLANPRFTNLKHYIYQPIHFNKLDYENTTIILRKIIIIIILVKYRARYFIFVLY